MEKSELYNAVLRYIVSELRRLSREELESELCAIKELFLMNWVTSVSRSLANFKCHAKFVFVS